MYKMFLKFFLSVVLMSVMVQEYEFTAFIFGQEEETPDEDLLVDFINELDEIEYKIKSLNYNTELDFNTVLKDVFGERLKCDDEYTKTKKRINEECQKLEEEAVTRGENIEECILTSEMQKMSLDIMYFNVRTNCRQKANEIMRKMVEDIKSVMKEYLTVGEIVEHFKLCNDLKCIDEFRVGATKSMIEKYNRIQKLHKSANNDLQKFVPNGIKCYYHNKNDTVKSFINIRDNLEICFRTRSINTIRDNDKSVYFEQMVKEIYNTFKNQREVFLELKEKMINIDNSDISEPDIASLYKKIETIMNQSKEVGKSVKKCLQKNRESLELSVYNTALYIASCKKAFKLRTTESDFKTINIISEAIKEINNLEKELQSCSKEACRVTLVMKAHSVEIQEKKKIARFSEEITYNLIKLNLEDKECVIETNNFNSEENMIIDDIQKCIIDDSKKNLFETLEKIISSPFQYVDGDNLSILFNEMDTFHSIVYDIANSKKKQNKKMLGKIIDKLSNSKDIYIEIGIEIGKNVQSCISSQEDKIKEFIKVAENNLEKSFEELTKLFIKFKEEFEILLIEENGNLYEFVREYHSCSTSACRIRVLRKGRSGAISDIIESIFDPNLIFNPILRNFMDFIEECFI